MTTASVRLRPRRRAATALAAVLCAAALPPQALALTAPAHAPQDTAAFDRSMTIERDFAPIIQQAAKIDRLPALEEPAPLQPAPVSYATWQARPMTTTQTGTLPVGQVIAEPDPATRGWLDAYCGSYLNTRAEAGIRIGRGFTLDGLFRFTRADLPLGHSDFRQPALSGSTATMAAPAYEWQAQHLAARLRAAYAHTFRSGPSLRLSAGAQGSKYNLFDWGLAHAAAAAPATPLAWTRLAAQPTQRAGTLFAAAQLDLSRWTLALDYRRTALDQPTGKDDDVASGTLALRASWYGRPSPDRHQWGGDILVGLSHGDWDGLTAKYVARYSALAPSGALRRFYADAGIGLDHTPLDRLLAQAPFALIPPAGDYARLGLRSTLHDDWDLAPQFDLFDLRLGYEDNEQGYLRWNVCAKARYTLGALVRYALYADGSAGAAPTHGTRTVFDHADDLTLGLGLSLDYEYSRHFGLTFAADYTLHTEPLAATDLPALSLEAHALVRPSRSLAFDLSFAGGFQREGRYRAAVAPVGTAVAAPAPAPEPIRKIGLDPILDLGLRADYRFSPRLAIYAFGTNLLDRKTDRWTLVPAQGIAIHGGLSWRF